MKNKTLYNTKNILFITSLIILLALFSRITRSATITSPTYILVETVTSGGNNISSTNYQISLSVGQLAIGKTNSTGYNVSLGRYYTVTVIRYLITLSITPSTAWWQDNITASGTVSLAGGAPVSGAIVTLKKDSSQLCLANTTSSGSYSCTFTAPDELGKYTIVAQIPDTEGRLLTVSVDLNIAAQYGDKAIGTVERSVYEIPAIIQEPSGKISTPFARVTIWRR